ncbi:cob(I)yrinic acid a,c-diamide adenosyltransferase [Methylomagnum sp.]
MTVGHRLSKIYTRTGDTGSTGLADGSRVEKDSPRIAAHGDLDELNSYIGLVIAEGIPAPVSHCLSEIQHLLFDLGGDLCIPGRQTIYAEHVGWLEAWLDYFNDDLPPLKEFVLPGGNRSASSCHVARTVCRRAERTLVALSRSESVALAALAFVNRLSDLLFVLARVLARQNDGQETLWQPLRPLAPAPR